MRVLFVTTEMDDFVRVGGLGAVSAALPRALRPFADIRIMLPGYRDIIEQLTHIQIVGRCPAFAEMPACSLGRAATKDGLPVYVLLCSQLYDRPGNPMAMRPGTTGLITISASRALPRRLLSLPWASWTRIGQQT